MAVKPVPYVKRGKRQMRDGKEGWRLRPRDPKSGRQLDRTFYGSYEEAVAELANFEEERRAAVGPAVPSARTVTVAEWAHTWLSRYKWKVPPTKRQAGQRRPHPTVAKNAGVLRAYIVPALGPGTRLETITYDSLMEAVADLTLRDGVTPASPSTKATAVSTLSLMFADAVRAGVLSSNPAAGLPTSWGATKRTGLIPSLPEAMKLAEAMDKRPHTRLGDMVRVITFTGLRIEELTGASIDDVDLDKRSLWVHRTVTESGGKRTVRDTAKTRAGVRSVVILDQAVKPIERLIKYSRSVDSDLLACGVQGGYLAYAWWRMNLKEAREVSGVDYTAHELRHVCASLLIASGADIEVVRQQMGHSTVAVTQNVYRHALKLDRSRLATRISEAVTDLYAEETHSP